MTAVSVAGLTIYDMCKEIQITMNKMGSENIWCEGDGMDPQADLRSDFLLNTSIVTLKKGDAFLFVGTNPRVEAPMVNARIRKAVRAGHAKVSSVGPPMDLAYDHQHLGIGPETLIQIAEGRHPFCSTLASAKYPVIIVGAGIFERKDKDVVMAAVDIIAKHAKVIRNEWNGFNVLLLNVVQAEELDFSLVLGSVPKNGIENAIFVYLLGADDIQVDKISKDAFVVYQGHHGDRSVYRANMILPGVAFSEKEGTYENTEGCTQQTTPAVPTVGDSRDDWKILRALSEISGVKLPYDTVNALRTRIRAVSPNLFRVDEREPASAWIRELKPEFNSKMSPRPFNKAIDNFYMTDSICRASKTMAQCTAALLGEK